MKNQEPWKTVITKEGTCLRYDDNNNNNSSSSSSHTCDFYQAIREGSHIPQQHARPWLRGMLTRQRCAPICTPSGNSQRELLLPHRCKQRLHLCTCRHFLKQKTPQQQQQQQQLLLLLVRNPRHHYFPHHMFKQKTPQQQQQQQQLLLLLVRNPRHHYFPHHMSCPKQAWHHHLKNNSINQTHLARAAQHNHSPNRSVQQQIQGFPLR